ncbi:MAG TPA: aldo/keto reductase [Capsulimonadaceae bacterium]|nr:aldo/keto reductase [Capsulimonadaceae bacterium]
MDKRAIGSLQVSLVGIGCNNFGGRIDYAATERVVLAALDEGINFFDTADVYGGTKSEEFLGKALVRRRDEAIIATKFGMQVAEDKKGASPAYIRQALEDSLRRLNTDRIDLYQLHAPDDTVPIADTLAALNELVQAGKVREIGCSNFSAEQLRQAAAAVAPGAARFVSVQNHFSLLHREPEKEVIPECDRLGIAFLPYFPLANGLLSGKYHKGEAPPEGSRIQLGGRFDAMLSDENLGKVEALRHFVQSRGHSLLDLAFSWLAMFPVVASVIAGATKPEQARANARAVGWQLSQGEMAEIDRIVGVTD